MPLDRSASATGPRPSWSRQRLTLASRPPPSPGDMLTLMLAWELAAPVTRNLATRNCPPGTSFQLEGTCQLGLG